MVTHWRDRRQSPSALLRADTGPSDGYHVWAVGGYFHYTRAFGPAACADVGADVGRIGKASGGAASEAARGRWYRWRASLPWARGVGDPLYVVQAVANK